MVPLLIFLGLIQFAGYITYPIIEAESNWIIDSWINYTHQKTWLQYPAVTAKEERMSGGFNDAWAFRTVQDALQIWDDHFIGKTTHEDTLKIYEGLKAKGELK